jgi:hydrogenase maturation protease
VREKKIAVVGAGNVLMGDEGVGVEVMRALEGTVRSAGSVDFIDAGTGFFTMVSDLDGYEAVVIIDAANGGGEPGAMYRFEVGEEGGGTAGPGAPGETAPRDNGLPGVLELRRSAPISLHDFGVLESIAWERVRGKLKGKVVLFGIEPWNVELRLGLSGPLEAKLDWYVERIQREIEAMLK